METINVEARDPVCGMQVNPDTARFRHDHGGRTYAFCCHGCLNAFKADPERYLGASATTTAHEAPARGTEYVCPMCPEVHQRGAGCLSELRHGTRARARPRDRATHTSSVHLPDASGDRAGRTRRLSDLRHGTRGPHTRGGGASEPRARGHDAAILDRCRAGLARVRTGYDGNGPRRKSGRSDWTGKSELDPIAFCHAGGALGRVALLPASLGVGQERQSEYVHPDRSWRRVGVSLQSGRDGRAQHLSRRVPRRWWRRALLRHGRGDHRAGSSWSGAGAARSESDGCGDPLAARASAQHGALGSRRPRGRGVACAGAGRRSPARPPGREDSRGRQGRRGPELGGRIDGDG